VYKTVPEGGVVKYQAVGERLKLCGCVKIGVRESNERGPGGKQGVSKPAVGGKEVAILVKHPPPGYAQPQPIRGTGNLTVMKKND